MIWKGSWDVETWTWQDNERARECCEAIESCIERGGIHPKSQEEYQRLVRAREEYKRRKQGNNDAQQVIANLEEFFARKK